MSDVSRDRKEDPQAEARMVECGGHMAVYVRPHWPGKDASFHSVPGRKPPMDPALQ